ncbi:hypothetical protein QQX98_002160 [Neonectria punicea]|uniref:Uncharacterized protein n=1 Tax=Neonectria punicea TaxID=979145 RepID=A0ABR1HJS2_9HYPO
MVRWNRSLAVALSLPLCTWFAGATADCPDAPTFTINSQEEADQLSKCRTFKGDIVISGDAVGNLTLEGPVKIDGKVYTDSDSSGATSRLSAISSDTIESITGDLNISSLGELKSISLPSLSLVGGALTISKLPELVDLHLEDINSVASFRLISAPKLLDAEIGLPLLAEDLDVGLKHITDETDAVIEVRDVGLEGLGGLMNFWNASTFILEDMPNLDEALLLALRIGQARISGNGKLKLFMSEKSVGSVQPVLETLNITGVRHISPCLWPDVHEFAAVNTTAEYLHFGFKQVRRLEIRDNPYMKTLVPWNGNNLWEWNLTDVLIQNNPLLSLKQYPRRANNDSLTELDCPFMYENNEDAWTWYPFHMNTVVINASIDNTFL